MLFWAVMEISVRFHLFPWFAYWSDVAMEDIQVVKVREAAANLCKLLWASVGIIVLQGGRAHTSISRFAPGFALVYWAMFPFSIHGLMIQSGDIPLETSMTGSTFGWGPDLPSSITRRYIWYKVY